jgi:hypothetical protein
MEGPIAMNMLLQIRSEEKKIAYERVESWKKSHKEVVRVWEAEDMIEGALASRDNDDRLFRYILRRSPAINKDLMDAANLCIQQICENSIKIHDIIREYIKPLLETGHPVAKSKELDDATKDYRTWKEDYPDSLAMSYQPVARVLRGRVKKLLGSSPKKSNWRKLFDSKNRSPRGKSGAQKRVS